MTMKKFVIGCVSENNQKYLSESLKLVKSIRWFGGSLSDSDLIVCVVDEVDPLYKEQFEYWGATVRVVERFHPAHPQSNKLRFLELPELYNYEVVMLLDCDTIVVQDPFKYIDKKSVQARIAGYPTVPHEIFVELFMVYGIKIPEKKYFCAVSGDKTILYCNAGVLVFPKKMLDNIANAWINITKELCDNIEILKESKNYCEQASLSLALCKTGLPFSELPIYMNCPVHVSAENFHKNLMTCDPVIIHYHHRVDENGLIIAGHNPFVRNRVEAFNRALINNVEIVS